MHCLQQSLMFIVASHAFTFQPPHQTPLGANGLEQTLAARQTRYMHQSTHEITRSQTGIPGVLHSISTTALACDAPAPRASHLGPSTHHPSGHRPIQTRYRRVHIHMTCREGRPSPQAHGTKRLDKADLMRPRTSNAAGQQWVLRR